MATEHVHMPYGALGRLVRFLCRAYASEVAEDTTGSLVRAWWRVATHPTPATFRAWSRRGGPSYIVISLLMGGFLSGLSAVIEAFYTPDARDGELNPQGRYLTHPTAELLVARAVANALALLLVLLTVLLAIAFLTRQQRTGGLRTQWEALLPAWALAQPAFGVASCINYLCTLGFAAMLQWLHATPPAPLAAMALDLFSYPVMLLWWLLFLGYQLVLLLSAVTSVVATARKSVGWLAFGAYMTTALLVGLTFTLVAQALAIPGPLFG